MNEDMVTMIRQVTMLVTMDPLEDTDHQSLV